jgi:hypothetical protein
MDDVGPLAGAIVVRRRHELQRPHPARQREPAERHRLVDEMDGHVGRDAAAVIPDRRRVLVLQHVIRLLNRSNQSLGHPCRGGAPGGVVVALERDLHQPIAIRTDLVDDGRDLGDGGGERFLHQYRYAPACKREHIARMIPGARGDHRHLDPLVRHLFGSGGGRETRGEIVRAEPRHEGPSRFERPRQPVADGQELDAAGKVEPDEMLQMHASHPADAEDADAKTGFDRHFS